MDIDKLLLTIIYAVYACLYNEGNTCQFLDMKHEEQWRKKVLIPNLNEIQEKFTGNELYQAESLEMLQEKLRNISIRTSENQVISLDLQYTIFHCQSGLFLEHLPKKFDPSKRQIYLACNNTDLSVQNNFFVIPHLKSLFQKFGLYCFYCQKYFTSKGCQHKCKLSESCFACRRVFLAPSTYTTLETKPFFCNGQISEGEEEKCEKCNVTLYSKECKEYHLKKSCRWGWKCLKCNIYQSRNRYFKSQSDIAAQHICGRRVCNYCGILKNKNHFCSLQKPSLKNEFTNLAFVFFEYSGYNPGKCKSCYLLNEKCEICANGYEKEKPIICSLLQEEESRESFTSYIFYDDEIERKNSLPLAKTSKSYFKKSYWPVSFKPELAPEGRKTRFSKRKMPYKSLHVFAKTGMTVVEKLLDYLLKGHFSNSTIFVHGQDLFYILQALHLNGFTPNIVKKENQIMLVEEKNLGLRFVETDNYVKVSQESSLQNPYFPFRWLHPHFFDYVGKPPKIDDFFCFEDCESHLDAKERFCNSLLSQEKWVFIENLTSFVLQKVTILADGILSFLQETFDAQIVLQTHLQPNKEIFLLHPVNPPIFTAPTYAFHLFLHFCKQANDLKSIKKEIYFRSSLGEIEYTSFLKWKHPEKNIIDAWSPFGQHDLKVTRPDAFSDSNIWFYNGCFFHGHTSSECYFKSKANKETQEEKRALFMKKIEKIQKEQPHLIVSIMWECQWRKAKREDPEIKEFIKKIYRFPPPQRLNPREAIYGGLNEVYSLYWSQELYPTESMHYLDINGFYAYIAMVSQFPTGSYEVHISKKSVLKAQQQGFLQIFTTDNLGSVIFDGDCFRSENNIELYGVALVRILAPKSLKLPVLPYRGLKGRSCLTLCKQCCNQNQLSRCSHTDW